MNVQKFNRRTLDALAASIYFYYARFYELMGKLTECRRFVVLAPIAKAIIYQHAPDFTQCFIECTKNRYPSP